MNNTETTANEPVQERIAGSLERIAAALEELVQTTKEKKNFPPAPPIRKKETCDDPTARARRKFIKPTVEELAAYIAEKGYSFDAEEFWNFYESNGWRVGRSQMKDWKAACATWQKYRERDKKRLAHIDARMDEREKRIDAKMEDRDRMRGNGGRRKADNNVEMTDEVREEVRRDFAL